ncbi:MULTISPECIES: phenylacetate--CoA ligase family protein [Flavobacteriaceae]|uniref:phenylacetate--CoA ligase family protein n=1 Tax=Flavobacteriaceae TaxID=49546 RepID=UPI001490B660|nr:MULTISPECIES: phenylacetate--CoA ligase family protein [Allomuricauda]MDC6364430.1 phenylacetate--CoA ligase family protein [Muricauda sp. AC10]
MPHLFEKFRNTAFWLLDSFKGRILGDHRKEIRKILTDPCDTDVNQIRQKNLNRLLGNAVNSVPFYKEYAGYTELSDFPIIDKNVVLNNYEAFASVDYKEANLYKSSSSGSTGIPFSIYQNKTKRQRNTADVIHFLEETGGAVGNKLYYIKLWDYTNAKKWWTRFVQNIFVHNVTNNGEEDMAKLISKIEDDNSLKTILGYPSFFEELCNHLDKNKVNPKVKNIKSIITISEALKQEERDRMTHYFKAPVFERYSNQENGILAQQTKRSDGKYVLNWASFHFEILELDSDKHVQHGGLGRIVVTDLFNFSMPLIRYDTGDMGIYGKDNNGFAYLSQIYGRRMDAIYDTKGNIVSPFIFYMVLDFSKVKQFQFIQKRRTEYLFKLNGRPEDVQEAEIIKYFQNYLGEDAIIKFSYVEEIPLLSSGKRKKIVNEYS